MCIHYLHCSSIFLIILSNIAAHYHLYENRIDVQIKCFQSSFVFGHRYTFHFTQYTYCSVLDPFYYDFQIITLRTQLTKSSNERREVNACKLFNDPHSKANTRVNFKWIEKRQSQNTLVTKRVIALIISSQVN